MLRNLSVLFAQSDKGKDIISFPCHQSSKITAPIPSLAGYSMYLRNDCEIETVQNNNLNKGTSHR